MTFKYFEPYGNKALNIGINVLLVATVALIVFLYVLQNADIKLIDKMDCKTILYHIHQGDKLDMFNAEAWKHPMGIHYYEDQYMQKCIGGDSKLG